MLHLKKLRSYSPSLTALILFSFSFAVLLYHIDYTSLHPWDEAWYAAISRNVLKGHWLDLQYNQSPFWDHPPLGFYLIATSFLINGVNEFADRVPFVLLGALSVTLVFLTGKKLANYWVGLSASLVLFSTRWFLFRARTGDLDILLVFCQLLVFYLAYNAKKAKDLYLLWFAFSLSLLAKSLISFSLFPLVAIPTYQIIKKGKVSAKQIFFICLTFLTPLLPWYGYNTLKYGIAFIYRNIFEIGVRKGTLEGLTRYSTDRFILYFHSMVNKWYQPFLVSLIVAIPFIKIRPIRWTLAYFILIATPFIISGKFEIWHLIPLSMPMSLLIPLSANEVFLFVKKRLNTHFLYVDLIFYPSLFLVFLAITLISWKSYKTEFYSSTKLPSTPAILAKATHNYQGSVLLDAFDDYSTTVVFYADKPVFLLKYLTAENEDIFLKRPFSLITSSNFSNSQKVDLNSCQEHLINTDYKIIYCSH